MNAVVFLVLWIMFHLLMCDPRSIPGKYKHALTDIINNNSQR